MSHRPPEKSYSDDSRPSRSAPPESPSFTISDTDPLVTVTPERSFTGMKAHTGDTTPLTSHTPAQCTRRTPGAEILGRGAETTRSIEGSFRLFQALENLKLSTSEGSLSDASFLGENESGGSPPGSDLYSLWGRPAHPPSSLERTGPTLFPAALHFPFSMPPFASGESSGSHHGPSGRADVYGVGESALRVAPNAERYPFATGVTGGGGGGHGHASGPAHSFGSHKGPGVPADLAPSRASGGHRRYPSTETAASLSHGQGPSSSFAYPPPPSVSAGGPPAPSRGYPTHSRVNSVGGGGGTAPGPTASTFPFPSPGPVYPFSTTSGNHHVPPAPYPPSHGHGEGANRGASRFTNLNLPLPGPVGPSPPNNAYLPPYSTTTTTSTTTNYASRFPPSSPTRSDSAPRNAPARADSTSSAHDNSQGATAATQAESPTSNMKFKQFFRSFKQKEKQGYEDALHFATEHLEILPDKIHWKVYLELADLAKRENRIGEARAFYQRVNQLQPTAAQGWLESAKMEEECGNLEECKQILSEGLTHCTVNESLMVKCLKHYERMNHLSEARALLGALKDVPVDRTWRTIMEGGLLEARQGNTLVARQVFHYLVNSVPWYGPIYQEACRFEEKCEEHANAMRFVELGLAENPRYGPLWFSALRLTEKLGVDGDVSAMHETVERAIKSISKELIWKLHFEAAQIEERAGHIHEAREFYVKSVAFCPENLLWKVWMGGARTELNYENIETARKLLQRALDEVPPKMKAMVLLECCRLEEYAQQMDKAREILAKAKKYTKHEWKVFLESVLLEMRANQLDRALQEAEEALLIHTGTGRLWAVMIQLKQAQGLEAQMQVFRQALSEVPKSGEVWCEGARIALQQNDFAAARKYINFAIQFTPQYGDSFIEYLRLEMLEKGEAADLAGVEQACVNADPNYGALWLHCKQNPLDSTRHVIRRAKDLLCAGGDEEVSVHAPSTTSGLSGPDGDSSATRSSSPLGPPAARALMVNDIYRNVHQRSNEERRKAIFL